MAYIEVKEVEEQFYKNKSRIKWIQEADMNAKFFHRQMTQHQARNRILSIQNSKGIRITDYEAAKTEVVNFYENLFTDKKIFNIQKSNIMQEIIHKQITQEKKHFLISPVSDEEVKNTLFPVKKGINPGPDGFTVDFLF
ncbi:hypothetical protein ACH5RR_009116 [Cinchona calisaya]|uniref:Uncharacterized protein n=1 Tax=Cinchona calisaya TaxID=153742 RepID=A0ABD3ADN5_9GENT